MSVQLHPEHDSSHASTSRSRYRTAFPIFTNFSPLRNSRHLRKVPRLMNSAPSQNSNPALLSQLKAAVCVPSLFQAKCATGSF